MTKSRFPDMPDSIRRLPKDSRGYPIPWFVAELADGTRDFRVIDPRKIALAHRNRLCFVCGRPLQRYGAFVIGPMCAVNRISAEPPSHPLCALFSVKACPFLSQPRRIRDDRELPAGWELAAGDGVLRNPGVTLIWWSLRWTPFRAPGGVLFNIGEPYRMTWWREGREATRAEIDESIRTGLPALEERAVEEGPRACQALRAAVKRLQPLLPSPQLEARP
jgi:hypothetical protein